MAANRISFDKKDAQIIASAVKGKAPKAEDAERISHKIKGYLDIQNGKAPSKLEKQKAVKAPKAPKAPAKKSAPAKKAPAKKQAAPKAPKAPAKKAAKSEDKPFKLPEMPKAFDAE